MKKFNEFSKENVSIYLSRIKNKVYIKFLKKKTFFRPKMSLAVKGFNNSPHELFQSIYSVTKSLNDKISIT